MFDTEVAISELERYIRFIADVAEAAPAHAFGTTLHVLRLIPNAQGDELWFVLDDFEWGPISSHRAG